MPKGVYDRSGDAPADPKTKRGGAERAALRTLAALKKQVGKLAAEVDELTAELRGKGAELARARGLMQQLEAFVNPAAVAPVETTREVAPVNGRPVGGPQPGENAAMTELIAWMRGQGHELDVLEPGKRYKLNRHFTSRGDLIAAANRDRAKKRMPEFEIPA